MAKTNLSDGEDLVTLTLGSECFMKTGTFAVGTQFIYHSTTVSPLVAEVESDGAQEVEYNPADQITDNLGNHYSKIIGGRPHVRIRS